MSDQIKQKAKSIEKIYQDYIGRIKDLRKKQNQIIDDLIKKLEETKIEEIKSKISR